MIEQNCMTTKVKERKVALQKLFDCLLSPSMAPLLVIEYSIKNREEKFFAFFFFWNILLTRVQKIRRTEARNAARARNIHCGMRFTLCSAMQFCTFNEKKQKRKNDKNGFGV